MLPIPTKPAAFLLAALAAAPLAAIPAFVPDARAQVALQSFAPLVKATKPAVVTVFAEKQNLDRTADLENVPEGMQEFFERFSEGRPELREPRSERRQQGLGSGFIIDASGIIVTNNHVINGADKITVRLDDGTEMEAELIGSDDKIDLAVLRVETAADLPTVAWGDSDAMEIGDWTVAIGNPFGFGGTVTTGIISARGRDLRSGPYDDYIQVDTAINRGNSGGPLFNLDGEVIGVNTAIISPTGGNVGLGFAIPSDQAETIVASLLETGTVERGWIGVRIQPVTPEIAESLGLEEAAGALVADVTSDSPAEAAGLQAGDVLLDFNDAMIETLRDLTTAVAASEIGSEARITVWRDGDFDTLSITPLLLEVAATGPTAEKPAVADPVVVLGLELQDAIGPQDEGVEILSIGPESSAARIDLREGDVILSVNQRSVRTGQELRDQVDAARAEERRSILLRVSRNGTARFVALALGTS